MTSPLQDGPGAHIYRVGHHVEEILLLLKLEKSSLHKRSSKKLSYLANPGTTATTMKNFHLIPFLLGSVLAKPTPQYFPPEYCQIKYTVDSVKHVQGDQITGDYTVPGSMYPVLTSPSKFS